MNENKIVDRVVTLVVIEDEAELRSAVVQKLRETEGFDCIGDAGTGEAGIELVLQKSPDVVLMDINLPDLSGVECVQRILAVNEDCDILMYTAFEDSKLVFDSLKSGAAGYIIKRRSFEELIAAIRDVLDGGAPMTPRIARKVVKSFKGDTPEDESLTQRENEVLHLVAKGMQNKEVARELDIAPETVRVHLRNVYQKWQVRNRAEATARFLGAG